MTSTDVLAVFNFLPEVVFTLNGTILSRSPEGWDKSLLKLERNRDTFATMHVYSGELGFQKTARETINTQIDLYGQRADILISIYELDKALLTYNQIFDGKLDTTEVKDDTITLKCKLIDNTLAGYIFAKKGIKYDIKQVAFETLDEYIGIFETTLINSIGEYETADVVMYGYYINDTGFEQPTGKFAPTITIQNRYNNGTSYLGNQPYMNDYDPLNPFTFDEPFAYRITGNSTLSLNVQGIITSNKYQVYDVFLIGINPSTSPPLVDETNLGFININIGTTLFDENYTCEVLGGYAYRLEFRFGSVQIGLNMTINVHTCFTTLFWDTVNSLKQISVLNINGLLQYLLYLMTEERYYTIEGLDDLYMDDFRLFLTSGDWIRGLSAVNPVTQEFVYSPTVTWDMVTDFLKALGYGYKILSDRVVFQKLDEIFDLTDYSVFLGNVDKLEIESFNDYFYTSIEAGYERFQDNAAAVKFDFYGKKVWSIDTNLPDNSLKITPEISGNAFEIDWKLKQNNPNAYFTDYEKDNKIYALVCNKYSEGGSQVKIYDTENAPFYYASIRLYNLDITPIRLVRNLSSLIYLSAKDENESYKLNSSEKNITFHSFSEMDNLDYYENRDFTPSILDFHPKTLKPFIYNFSAPTINIFNEILTNREKLVIFTFKNKYYAGFVDDLTKNATIDEPQNWRLIQANLTEDEIKALL